MEAWEILLFIICAGGMMLIPTGYDLIKGGFRWDGIAVGLLMIAYGFCMFCCWGAQNHIEHLSLT